MAIAKSFSAVGVSAPSLIRAGARALWSVTGTYVGTVVMDELIGGGVSLNPLSDMLGPIAPANAALAGGIIVNDSGKDKVVQFRCPVYTSGTIVCALTDVPPGADITAGVGVPASLAGMTVQEEGSAVLHRTTFLFANLLQTLLDAQNGGGQKIYTFPEGRILIHGAAGAIAITTTSVLASTLNTGITANWGVGSTTQANGTLATTEQNILPTAALTASANINVAGAISTNKLAAGLPLDGTAAAIAAFLNIGVATATDIDADATVLVNGFVEITWSHLGDY